MADNDHALLIDQNRIDKAKRADRAHQHFKLRLAMRPGIAGGWLRALPARSTRFPGSEAAEQGATALKLLLKLLKRQGCVPEAIVTDGASFVPGSAALTALQLAHGTPSFHAFMLRGSATRPARPSDGLCKSGARRDDVPN